jgi:hypothetical protein
VFQLTDGSIPNSDTEPAQAVILRHPSFSTGKLEKLTGSELQQTVHRGEGRARDEAEVVRDLRRSRRCTRDRGDLRWCRRRLARSGVGRRNVGRVVLGGVGSGTWPQQGRPKTTENPYLPITFEHVDRQRIRTDQP